MKVFEVIESEWDNVPEPEADLETRLDRLETKLNSYDRQLWMMRQKINRWVKEGILVIGLGDEGGTWLHLNPPRGHLPREWEKKGLYFHLDPNNEKSWRMYKYLPKFQEKWQNIVNQKVLTWDKFEVVRGPV